MTKIHFFIVALVLAAAALAGCLGDDEIIWGTLGESADYVVWGS
jgi:hypothetical protein